MEIEKLAATDPDKIVTVRVDIAEGLGGYHVNNLTYGMGLSGDLGKQVGAVVRGLYKTFRAYDAQLAEINPLFITKDGKAIAGDGKLIIDDNSVWRQPATPLPATTSTPKSNSKPRRKASPTSSSTATSP